MAAYRGWRGRRRAVGFTELRGRLLPVKDELPAPGDSDGDSEGPDDSDPEFLDAEEIDGGARQVKSWRVPSTRGPPSYELDDDSLGEVSILPLFLHKCNVPDVFTKDFLDWLPRDPPVTFSTLIELANDFDMEEGKNILPYLQNLSSPGAFVFLSLEIPLVMKYLPRLLPSKVRSLFLLDSNDQKSPGECQCNLLYDLERMLADDPWKLGFGLILYRELHLCGCEASWESFLHCEDLLVRIPSLQINALIIYNELKKKCMELGDTYVELSDLNTSVTNAQDMPVEDAWEALEFLKTHEIVVMEQKRIFLYRWYWYEMHIAEYIQNIVQREPWSLDVYEEDVFGNISSPHEQRLNNTDEQGTSNGETAAHCSDNGDGSGCAPAERCSTQLDADQKKAVRMILANPVTVISGKGGCGKTTVVSQVFKSMMKKENDEVEKACKALEEDIDASEEWFCDAMTSNPDHSDSIRVLLTAPTGKAASLLKKKTDLPAATLHQVTCSYSAWRKLDNDQVKWKFSNVEALVVDEASLVSVRMFSAVLKLLYSYGKLAKLVILGDVRQLPSIEPGNLLADVFAALSRLNWAIELKTNHRAESQLIVDNATRISHQFDVEFDAYVHIDGHNSSAMANGDKKFILVSLAHDADLSTAISTLLKNGPGLEDDKHSQFIAFRRNDCLLINEVCCKHYSKHTMKNHKNKFQFLCGDKVCCTKNAYVKDLVSRPRNSSNKLITSSSSQMVTISQPQPQFEEARILLDNSVLESGDQANKEVEEDDRLCNGEIFFVVNDVTRDRIRELTLSDGEDREYTLNYKALRSRSGLQHAWARTIHTFQGSEEDTVVYVLGTAGRQNWKHVYTAVTRGRKRVYIIARKDQLDRAISNKARDRKTRLQQRLKDKLPQGISFSQPTAASSVNPESSQAVAKQEPDFTLTSTPVTSFTQLKSPPHRSFPPESTTAVVAPSTSGAGQGEHANYITHTPPDCLQDCSLEVSPSQKRTRGPVDDSETPKKIRVNKTNLTEESPDSQKFELLSLRSPNPKKLFD
ncbi:DNA helicase B isoform X2 [Engystomops pustulosus]|uniref:DNA helicase B isoform X2 n=1 Tax=Engystomops pustulosus TaxID=76066 RepID=UPI003AFAEF1C